MNKDFSDDQNLIFLAEEKIKCLQALLSGLQQFYADLEKNSGDKISALLGEQESQLVKIKDLDQKYLSMIGEDQGSIAFTGCRALDLKLAEQKNLIDRIISLDKMTVIKAEKISAELKEKLRNIRRQKSIIDQYHQEIDQTGSLFDFKEGKKF